MACNECGDKPVKKSCDFPRAVVEINNPEQLVLLRKVMVPASMGDEEEFPPAIGKYYNVILQYETNGHIYLYSSDGIPTAIESSVPQEIYEQLAALEAEDVILQEEIDAIKNSPDVVDIVPTYAALQQYDTSSLGDKDVIRVLADETHDGQSTYYRWNLASQTWTYIGAVGDYYTKAQVDALLSGKQNTLTFDSTPTSGSNNPVTSAGIKSYVDTQSVTFKSFPESVATTGTTQQFMNSILALNPPVGMAYLGTVSLSDMPGGLMQEEVEVYVYSDYVVYCVMRSTDVAPYAWWCASYNYQGWQPVNTDTTYTAGTNVSISSENVISATDTTYTAGYGLDLTGTEFSVDPTIIQDTLVAGDNITIEDESGATVISATDTTYSAGTGIDITNNVISATSTGPTVVQTTGTSTTDVMSQNATTSMVFGSSTSRVKIGSSATSSAGNTVAIGDSASASASEAMALGQSATASHTGSVALGTRSRTSVTGEIAIGPTSTVYGYNNSNYRLLTGLYDPQSAHDAATKGYVDTGLLGKQDELTAGSGISIAEESGALVISATGAEVSTISNQDWSALWQ